MKVLIVDDTGAQRFIIKKIFLDSGIAAGEISEAENGQKALDKVMEQDFSLIIVDWNMPVMDGLEFLIEVRKIGKSTPIIMVTSENEKSKVNEALSAGANHFMTKPFTGVKLMEIAKQYLG